MFEEKLGQCTQFLQSWLSFGTGKPGFSCLEVGTGWHPIVPLCLYLCGAREVWTFDIEPLLSLKRLRQLMRFFVDYDRSGKLKIFLPQYDSERLRELCAVVQGAQDVGAAEILSRLAIYAKVQDAQATGLPAGSIDLLFSNGVLQYIPRSILQGIFSEARRLASGSSIMAHRIRFIDQFSYFDNRISTLNFLRYSGAQWRWLNSPLIYQNRLRVSDFRDLLNKEGFELLSEESLSAPPQELAKVELAREFKRYSREDLLVSHSFIVARPK